MIRRDTTVEFSGWGNEEGHPQLPTSHQVFVDDLRNALGVPGTESELANSEMILASMRKEFGSLSGNVPLSWRRSMKTRLFTTKAAAAALTTVLLTGGAAAAATAGHCRLACNNSLAPQRKSLVYRCLLLLRSPQ